MKITFVFASNPAWWAIFSGLIEKAEKTDVSHCAIKISGDGYSVVYESVFPTSRKIGWDKWSKKYNVQREYTFDIPEDKLVEMFHSLNFLIGRPYSLPQIVLIGFSILSSWFESISRTWKLNNYHGLICSEMVGIILLKYFNVEFQESIDRLGLNDVENACKELQRREQENGSIWIP